MCCVDLVWMIMIMIIVVVLPSQSREPRALLICRKVTTSLMGDCEASHKQNLNAKLAYAFFKGRPPGRLRVRF